MLNITAEEDIDDGIPLWKRALMKKRMSEEKNKKQEEEKMVIKLKLSV